MEGYQPTGVRIPRQTSEKGKTLAERNMAIRAAVFAALGHHKPDYRSAARLDEAAKIITNFVARALDDLNR